MHVSILRNFGLGIPKEDVAPRVMSHLGSEKMSTQLTQGSQRRSVEKGLGGRERAWRSREGFAIERMIDDT